MRRGRPSRRGCCALIALAWLSVYTWARAPAGAAAETIRPAPVAATGAISADAGRDFDVPSPLGSGDSPRVAQVAPLAPPTNARDESAVQGAPADDNDGPARAANRTLTATLERRGDLTLRNSTLDAALFTISELWGINIVVGKVEGSVNGVFKGAPLREILDSILLSNGYGYRAVGDSLVVSRLSELGQINPFFESATIPVHTADVDEVVDGARLLSTPQGQIRALKSARSLFVLDFPDRVAMIRDFVQSVDGASRRGLMGAGGGPAQPLEVGHFRTQFITAAAAREALSAVMSKDGRVGIMQREDRLLISDYPENLAMIEAVLKRIDYPRPQVRITALIYDISLQDVEQLGINWNQVGGSRAVGTNRDRQTSLGIDSIMQVPFQANTAGTTLTLMNLSRHIDITAVATALQNANDARLLADPNVVVLENEEAIFQSVSEIPYQQLTQTEGGGQIGTTAFKDAGISLRVRPKISVDGTIAMEVTPEFSRLTGFTPGDNQPIIDRRTASTVLRVANRQTVVIGGLRQRSDVGDFKGVPYLKDVKGVGRLFRSRDTNVRESELVVFIMPEVIGYADDPTVRQKLVRDTVDCRLDQVPEAEGCPPCCRRLPVDGMMYGPAVAPPAGPIDMSMETGGSPSEQTAPGFQPSAASRAPDPGDLMLPPLSAGEIPSAELQFGAIGRSAHVRAMVADGRLRRLPAIDAAAVGPELASPAYGLFGAPPAIESPLRPQYEARFRATGGLTPTQQRAEERTVRPVYR